VDYSTLYEALKAHFQDDPDSPFKDYNFEASNLSQLLKILAYATHINLFHTSLALNEQFLSTARLRKNVVKQLPAYGYSQRRNTASHKYLTLKNDSTYDYVLQDFTEFDAVGNEETDDKKFYNIESYTVPAGGTEVIAVYQSSTDNGYVETDLDISSDGDVLTEVAIDVPDLAEQYLVVQTVEDEDVVSWIQYESLDSLQNQLDNADLTLLPSTNIYFLDETENGYKIRFSTTGIGAKPNPDDGKTLTVKYMECDGSASNGFSTSSFSFTNPPTGISILSDTDILASSSTGVSSGGQDKETVEELRENMLSTFSTQNRAVTEYDYTKLGKASELIGETGNVQVYGGEKHICGKRLGKVFIVASPAGDTQFFFSDAEKTEIESYFRKYNITGITPSVQNPHYINAIAEYDFVFKSLISDTADIAAQLKEIIRDFFKSNFGETIYVPQLVEEVNRVFGVESAYVKTKFRIIFDTLSDLTGTYKLIPLVSSEASDFIGTSGQTYSGYVFGFTDDSEYSGENYGEVVSVNVDAGYLVVKQESGVTNTNFEKFVKGATVSDYLSRKDALTIQYLPIDGSNDIYISNTNGIIVDGDVVALSGGSAVTTATVTEIERSSSGKRYASLQLNSSIYDGTTYLKVGSDVVNVGSIVGRVLELTGTTQVFLSYNSGSDYSEGQDLDFGTSYSAGKFNIAKRQTLYLYSIVNGSSAGGTGLISVGNSIVDMYSVVGNVEAVGTCAGAGSGFINVWWTDSDNYQSAPFYVEIGTSWYGGSTTGKFDAKVVAVGTRTAGVGPTGYRVRVSEVTSEGFHIGTSNIEPGDSWGFNRIVSIGASTNLITVEDPLRGIVIGDSICNSSTDLISTVIGVTGNTMTLEDGTGFNVGALVHPGYDWSSVQFANIVRVDPVYDESDVVIVVLDNAVGLGSASFLKQSSGLAQITEIGTSTTILGSTSSIAVSVSNSTGVFYVGDNNTLCVQTADIPFEPMYTLSGNIEDFTTDYIIQYDEDEELRFFINKLDYTESGMLDSHAIEKSTVGYSLMFNTTQNLDRTGVKVWVTYGTSSKTELETAMNKKYQATLKINSAIGGTFGATVNALAQSDRVTIKNGTSILVAVVSEVSTVNSVYTLDIRYDSATFVFPVGTANSIVYGDAGLSWNGSSARNYILSIASEKQSPDSLIFYCSGTSLVYSGTAFSYVEVDLLEGDVAVRRAETVTSILINSGTTGFQSVDTTNKRLYFTDTSGFPLTGGTASYILNIWNSAHYDWDEWEYTTNTSTSNPPYLESINELPEDIAENMRVVFDLASPLKRVEVAFTNKLDKLKLGNRALFYSSEDLVIPIENN